MPCLVRYPKLFPAGTVLNGIFSHNDWFVTLSALVGMEDIADRLKAGAELDGNRYKVHLDGHNQLDYLSGKTDKSAREHFFYVNDEGDLVALRFSNWKFHFMENRCPGTLRVWAEPFTALRVPKLYNLRTDPFEKASFFFFSFCFRCREGRGRSEEEEEEEEEEEKRNSLCSFLLSLDLESLYSQKHQTGRHRLQLVLRLGKKRRRVSGLVIPFLEIQKTRQKSTKLTLSFSSLSFLVSFFFSTPHKKTGHRPRLPVRARAVLRGQDDRLAQRVPRSPGAGVVLDRPRDGEAQGRHARDVRKRKEEKKKK